MSIINTVGTASRQYSTSALWHASLPGTTTGGYEGHHYNDTEFSGKVKITGHTTSAVNYILMTAAAGQSFQDHASVRSNALAYDQTKGVGIAASSGGGGGAVIQIDNDYVTVSRLQVKIINGGAYNDGGMLISTASCTHSVIKENIVAWTRSTNYNYPIYAISGVVANNVVYNTQAGFNLAAIRANNHAIVVNNTAVNTAGGTSKGFEGLVYGCLATNNLAVGWSTCFSGTFDAGSNYNAATDTTAPGANSLQSRTAATELTSTTTDFRLKAGATSIGAGSRDAINAPNDISGYTRPSTCDIGAWQTTAAAAVTKAFAFLGNFAMAGATGRAFAA